MSTWFARRVLDLVGVLSETYYARKYGAMARRLGRPGIVGDQQRGFIVIQIDGLAYDHLLQAIAGGYMPYLGRLLAERRLTLAPWRCGVPSTTPAVQAGIMFGDNFDIPGFRWYEKERGISVTVNRPDQTRAIQERISRGRRGILQGGSSYVNMMDGGADLALFTVSALHPQRFFESVRGAGLLLLFLLSPFRVLRLLGLTAVGYLKGLGLRLAALVRRSVYSPLNVLSPLIHAITDALFNEVQTFGVMLDIYRRVPAIYANYNSYDEVAHKLGPDHRAALATLRAVDKRIHQIDRMRARYRRREYDLHVLSDHGNSPSVPFTWRSGMSLGRYIVEQIGEGLSVDEEAGPPAHSAAKARFLLEELRGLEERLSPRARQFVRVARRYLDRRLPTECEGRAYDWGRWRDVVVRASGPLAHVYFNISPHRLSLSEVALVYPQLLARLLDHPGVGLVVVLEGLQTVALGRGGTLIVDDGECTVEGPHPLAPFGDVEHAAREIHRLASFPHSGDLILLGAVEADGKVVTFEEQVGSHGGVSGPQERPFLAWPPEVPLNPDVVNNSQELYLQFTRLYLGYPRAGLLEEQSIAAPVVVP